MNRLDLDANADGTAQEWDPVRILGLDPDNGHLRCRGTAPDDTPCTTCISTDPTVRELMRTNLDLLRDLGPFSNSIWTILHVLALLSVCSEREHIVDQQQQVAVVMSAFTMVITLYRRGLPIPPEIVLEATEEVRRMRVPVRDVPDGINGHANHEFPRGETEDGRGGLVWWADGAVGVGGADYQAPVAHMSPLIQAQVTEPEPIPPLMLPEPISPLMLPGSLTFPAVPAQLAQPAPQITSVARRPLAICGCCRELIRREADAVWCRGQCGMNIHTTCFVQWRSYCLERANAEGANPEERAEYVTCIYCRTRWI